MTTPQDPQDPQNPYGEPTPPPAEPTQPAAESTPPPAEPGPPTQPAPPPYGEPQAGQSAYGQPASGQQPQYGQPAYGQPAFPVSPENTQPSKAMAITALVLSLLICIPFLPALVAIVLGVIVLGRGRDGRNHGKGMAITAIIISVLALLAWIGGIIGLTMVDWDELVPVEQLDTGECLNASNLTDESEDFVEDIEEVPCTSPHDAEVLATKELTAEEAETYDVASSNLCAELLESSGAISKVGPDISFFGLTWITEPNAGDKLVCIAYSPDGEKLTAPL